MPDLAKDGSVVELLDDAAAEHLLDDGAPDVAGLLDVLVVVADGRVVGDRRRDSGRRPWSTRAAGSRDRAWANDGHATALAPRTAERVGAVPPDDRPAAPGAGDAAPGGGVAERWAGARTQTRWPSPGPAPSGPPSGILLERPAGDGAQSAHLRAPRPGRHGRTGLRCPRRTLPPGAGRDSCTSAGVTP